MAIDKGKRLGRGLEALIPSAAAAIAAAPESTTELRQLPLAQIRPNPYQPRREFAEADLAELQASISASGLLQPVTVRKRGDGYELIAGERRLRAVTRLGWPSVPAVVKEVDDRTLLTLALVENLQRADLNAIEEAIGYRRLIDEFGYTQQQVGDAIGKDRTTITNLLRVLTLPKAVQTMVERGELSTGHARALLVLTVERDVIAVANEAVTRHFTVRETEKRARDVANGPSGTPKAKGTKIGPLKPGSGDQTSAAVRGIENDLRRRLQTDVKVNLTGPDKGSVEISFYSNDDLQRLLELMLGDAHGDFGHRG